MSSSSSSLLAAAAALTLASPAAALVAADGSYSCALDGKTLAKIELSGDKYRVDGGAWQKVHRIGPAFMWSGDLGGISAAGEVIGSMSMGDTSFEVQIKDRATRTFHLVTCKL